MYFPYQSCFYSPTDAQLIVLKTILKFTLKQLPTCFRAVTPSSGRALFLKTILKFTLKQLPTCFGAVTPSSGRALFMLAKVTVVKITNSLLPNSATYTHQEGPTNIRVYAVTSPLN